MIGEEGMMVCYVCVQSELLGSFLRRLILHGGGVLIWDFERHDWREEQKV